MRAPEARAGGSLVEVIVALVVLEVGLLGAAGLLLLAAAGFGRAVLVERAAAEAAAVADSLSRAGADEGGGGERVNGPWRTAWEKDTPAGWIVRAGRAEAERWDPVVELRVP